LYIVKTFFEVAKPMYDAVEEDNIDSAGGKDLILVSK
jgi:hypothetical protein